MQIENESVRMKILRPDNVGKQNVKILGIYLGWVSDDDMREIYKTFREYVRTMLPAPYIETRRSMKFTMLQKKILEGCEELGDKLYEPIWAEHLTEYLCKHGILVPEAITDIELIDGMNWAGTSPARWRDWLIGLSKKTDIPVDEIEATGINVTELQLMKDAEEEE